MIAKVGAAARPSQWDGAPCPAHRRFRRGRSYLHAGSQSPRAEPADDARNRLRSGSRWGNMTRQPLAYSSWRRHQSPARCVPWGAVEPLVHTPEAVQSARISGIGVVDDAIFEHERAHARPVARYVAASVPHMAANLAPPPRRPLLPGATRTPPRAGSCIRRLPCAAAPR